MDIRSLLIYFMGSDTPTSASYVYLCEVNISLLTICNMTYRGNCSRCIVGKVCKVLQATALLDSVCMCTVCCCDCTVLYPLHSCATLKLCACQECPLRRRICVTKQKPAASCILCCKVLHSCCDRCCRQAVSS